MTVYARFFDPQTAAPRGCVALLDEFAAHPEFLAYPMHPQEARASLASAFVNPANLTWFTYNDQALTGFILLTRVYPRIDALLHFMFLDKDLAGKRQLLRNLIGYFFTDLGFNRLSMEVPEGVRLERFARKVLDFRLEGEIRPRNPELPKALSDNWVARQGSRREASYFDGKTWKDILLLRVLASEWMGGGEGNECLGCHQHSHSVAPSSEPSPEAADPRTPSQPSPKTSSPSDNRT